MAPSRAFAFSPAMRAIHLSLRHRSLSLQYRRSLSSTTCRASCLPSSVAATAARPTSSRVPSIRAFTQSHQFRQATLQPPPTLDENERSIFEQLRDELAPVIELEVQDASGGCGQMYNVSIMSERFKGLSIMKQHRLVNSVLGERIKGWHGMHLVTRAP